MDRPAVTTRDELTAATLQDVVTELQQGREVMLHISKTLVSILEGQHEIREQIELGVRRDAELGKRVGGSEGKIKLLESRVNHHAAEIQQLKISRPPGTS